MTIYDELNELKRNVSNVLDPNPFPHEPKSKTFGGRD